MLLTNQRKSFFTTEMDKISLRLLMLFSLVVLGHGELSESDTIKIIPIRTEALEPTILSKHATVINETTNSKHSSDAEEFENMLLEYVGDVMSRDKINIIPGIYIQKTPPHNMSDNIERKSSDDSLIGSVKDFLKTHSLRVELARASTATGRLFFFKGKT